MCILEDIFKQYVGATFGRPLNTLEKLYNFLLSDCFLYFYLYKIGRFRATKGRPYDNTGDIILF